MNKLEIEKAISNINYGLHYEDCGDMVVITKFAAQLAISALAQLLNDGWIPVSERLPNEEECNIYEVMHPCHRQFICTVKIGEYEPQTRQLFFSKIFGWKYGPEDYNEHVIAWQPLPEPWKETV